MLLAAQVAQQEMNNDLEWVSYLSDKLKKGIRAVRCLAT
jgi:hypothetical protein